MGRGGGGPSRRPAAAGRAFRAARVALNELTLDVGPPAHGGVCVARAPDGRTVFVRHALPGEVVRAVVTEDRGRFLRADAVAVLTASPDRVEEPCPYAKPGRCGGCDWQHAALPAQRELKAAVVREQLARLGGGTDVPVTVEAVPGDVAGLGWRTRVRFAATPDGALGLRRHRSTEVQPLDFCLIAAPGVEAVGAERLRWPGASEVEVIAAASGDRLVVLPPRGRFPRELPEDVSVLAGERTLRGRPGVRERAVDRTWWVGGSGFWQVHPGAADALAAAVLGYLDPAPADTALDLYAGVGLFTAVLAPLVREVVAVESDPRAVADARQNLRDLPRVRVEEGRTDAVLRRLGLGRAELVVLDPPRTGAGAEVMTRVAALSPRRVAYVACDPAALARDVATARGLGYRLTALRAFDLFPMTHHVECVALLEPAGAG